MKPVVALTLLVGACGRALESKRRHPQDGNHSASLLGERKQDPTTVSLDDATNKLSGVADAVAASINEVKAGYNALKAACATEVKATSSRVQAQTVKIAELETTRHLNLERTAGYEASLTNLVSQEEKAHTSYESAVTQRATALQTHLSTNAASVDQAKVIGDVLAGLKNKRAQITASQTSTENYSVPVPASPTSSASALDYVIGVLSNIEESTTAKAHEGVDEHNTADADFERLVTSYKASLQHIDEQYQAENIRRMEAKNIARDTNDEEVLRTDLVADEEKFDKEYINVCGTDGESGDVKAATEALDYLLSTFQQQSANAINIMDGLPDLVATSTGLLQVKQSRSLRGTSGAPANSSKSAVLSAVRAVATGRSSPKEAAYEPESAQVSAARWVIAQAAKHKDHASQTMAEAVSAKFPHGVPPRKVVAHPVKLVKPAQPVHMLAGAKSKKAKSGKAKAGETPSSDNALSDEITQCVSDKQELTDQIIAARKAAREARTSKMSAAARSTALAQLRVLVESQRTTLAAAASSVQAGWKSLIDLRAADSFPTTMTDASTEMTTISSEVETYINAGGPPASAGLPTALAGITSTLTKTKERLENDMQALEVVYSDILSIQYAALDNKLVQKESTLETEEGQQNGTVTTATQEATAQETLEKNLMTNRATVDYRCLQEDHCTNLAYQQCCTAGTGSNMIKVTSWAECTAHCEKLVQEGNQIIGCEMTNLYKGDDTTGSGTCYTLETCTLQQSSSNCAGSLCKPHAVTSSLSSDADSSDADDTAADDAKLT
jgi:hypothetical protein